MNEPEGKPDALSTLLLLSLWGSLCAYIASYNNSSSLASVLSLGTSAFFGGLVFFVALFQMKFAAVLSVLIGVLLSISAILYFAGSAGETGALVRYCISLSALGVFSFARVPDCRATVAIGAAVIVAYAAFVALTAGPLSYSGVVRFTPFFAGETAVHSSSLTMVALVIILWCSPWRMKVRIPLCIVGTILIIGYGVTTALLMLAIFFAARTFEHYNISLKWIGLVAAILLPLGAAWRDSTQVEGGDVESLGVGSLGSGRLAAWLERIEIFIQSDIVTKAIGGGAYSDYRTTSLWWWSEKSAHSDAMTILMEFGLLGVVTVVCYFCFVYRTINNVGRAVLLAILAGMVLSNVVLDRPTVAMVWGFAIYCATRHGDRIDSPGRETGQNQVIA
ncbi:hypothetical protein QNO08_04715 [Arthrobacter sp. zg-Y820]|uniref:hypothetical protein n=1 Tax=Arthrobacter sp. zg-Y820 TaxID=2894192 RepID=UPI0024DF5C79|nr:hypothetical protein [Arthrobacter sp. zg-Y820]WIB10359.1 hypothetical protein QNO08_04715 [Arthrobacter sp. zg-Y820]